MKLSQITHIAIMAMFVVVMAGAPHAGIADIPMCVSIGGVSISPYDFVDVAANEMASYYNLTDKTWTTAVEYFGEDTASDFGDVSGIYMCSSETMDTTTTTFKDSAPSSTPGSYCWCKILSPVEMEWYVFNDGSSINNCSGACASACISDAGFIISNFDYQ